MESLSKFGVPMGGGSGRGGMLALKLKYRYRVRVINFGPIAGGMDITQQVQSVGKPKLTHDEVEVHSYNSTAWYAGKHKWDSIQLVLKDDVTNAMKRLVGHQMQKQLNHFEQTGYMAGINYKFTMLIETMDGGNDAVIETWTIEGCFLSNVDEGDLDYSDSQYQTTTLTIRFDNATLNDGLMSRLPESIPGVRI